MVISFKKSGRIFINREVARMTKISFPGQEACVLAEKYFMANLCLPMWILHGGALPVLEMKAMGV